MSADGTRLLDDGKKVYEGPVAEGTKLFKKDGYYYISIPEGWCKFGLANGDAFLKIFMDLMNQNVYWKWELTKVNGPHQGLW